MTIENPIQEKMSDEIKLKFLMDDDAPGKVAPLVKAYALELAKSGVAPKDAVAHACHGALSGLLLIDKKLPKGAVASMHGINEAAQSEHWDPMESMTWAMDGCARIKPAVSEGKINDIEIAINEAFHGAGEVFRGIAAKY
jgi:hypothetical protein